ncbi:MAG: ATP-binding protein [Anaerolineae bacterium]
MREQAIALAGMDMIHLQAELQRIDLRLQRAVHLWQRSGQDPDDAFRGLYVSDEEVERLLGRPLATSWGQAADLPSDVAQAFSQRATRIDQEIQRILDAAHEQRHEPRLERLRRTFGLSRFEMDTLLICLAPSIDLRYERVYGYLQDDVTKKRPTVNLVLDLLAEPGVSRLALLAHFSEDAPLFQHRLLELQKPRDVDTSPVLSHFLHMDESLVAWMMGNYQPQADLAGHLHIISDPTDGYAAFEDDQLREPLSLDRDQPIYVFYGTDSARQRAAAGLLAKKAGSPLLVLDLDGVLREDRTSAERAIGLALRDARLIGAIPMLAGWDSCLVDDNVPPPLLRQLYTYPGTVIVAGEKLWVPKGLVRDRRLVQMAFDIPPYPQRRRLWAHFVGPRAEPLKEDLEALAGQFALSSEQIRDAVASAKDRAKQRGASLAAQDLYAAARAHSNPRLANLAHKIAPRYGWDDIILPEDQRALLHEIINTVRGRPQVLDGWGVGEKLASNRGVTVLFAGPPGTGKTMAAEIIAGELGLDLYRIDLSTIVSKYIGETEKNIERIFKEAERSNAILFFDEADALFGKRSEVRDSHDRYANIEVSYLLQRMEAYDGVTILATNLRANLDEAFTRRLQFAVNFPFPEAEDRLKIWETLFPPQLPRAPGIDFRYLAERFRLAGGNIRNVIVSAAYLAAADGEHVTMAHLLHGTRRELQKMGKLVREEDVSP